VVGMAGGHVVPAGVWISASSTAAACAPCAGRLSCVRLRGRRGSRSRRGAAAGAGPRRIRSARG